MYDLKEDYEEPLEKFMFTLEKEFDQSVTNEIVQLLVKGMKMRYVTDTSGIIYAVRCTLCNKEWRTGGLSLEDGHEIAKHWADGECEEE